MSASIARPPRPPTFKISQCDLPQVESNDLTLNLGSLAGLGGKPRPFHPQPLEDRQRVHNLVRPAQYAHPLQLLCSSGIESIPFSGRLADEHMLRRKTPNGTLAAGYDGNQVEWTTRPHASKHLVMQAEMGLRLEDLPYVGKGFGSPSDVYRKQQPRQESATGVGRVSWAQTNHAMPIESPSHASTVKSDLEHGPPEYHRRAAPRMDSILNQSQGLQQPFIGGGFHNGPAALQSGWLPSVGPTASNKQGQYGPYWPDGAFIPYRPAAFRDLRLSFENKTTPSSHLCDIHSNNGSLVHGEDKDLQRCRDYNGRIMHQSIGSNEAAPSVGSHQCSHLWHTQRGRNSDSRVHRLLYENPSHTLQFKEKILIEAHRAYLNLLATQQQARQHGSNGPHSNDRFLSHMATFSSTISNIRTFQTGQPSLALSPAQTNMEEMRRPAVSVFRQPEPCPTTTAMNALEVLTQICQESEWQWVDGILLGGCLAYCLANYEKALQWYYRVLACDPNNVEATSNVAATLLSLHRKSEAEQFWLRSVRLRPTYFEAVEHLVGLLCTDQRSNDAVKVIEFVETALKLPAGGVTTEPRAHSSGRHSLPSSLRDQYFSPEQPQSLFSTGQMSQFSSLSQFGFSGFAIPDADNGRMLALIHAKGNMLYGLGDNAGAAKAFEDAILIGTGHRVYGIRGLITSILRAFANDFRLGTSRSVGKLMNPETILLPPELALRTASIVFQPGGQLPGLHDIAGEHAKRAAISTISNSLLSLAKIYQDGVSSGTLASSPKLAPGVHDILALYYLSLSLQPSPSTANNVGILLASIQHISPHRPQNCASSLQPLLVGVVPGSGIALALSYYKYGLELDDRHAHLYTNLGSLLKDIGQLSRAIEMYQKAVACDGSFDIALANLANAVKDQGRICDAIAYYRKAVQANPDFAEAVCGLANALNSVCDWRGRGGVATGNAKLDRWHVDKDGMLLDARRQHTVTSGLVGRVAAIVGKQLCEGLSWGKGVLRSVDLEQLFTPRILNELCQPRADNQRPPLLIALDGWARSTWEGAKVVRLVERITKRLCWQVYQERLQHRTNTRMSYQRPQLPSSLSIPTAPTVLPFHTFTCPLVAKQIRQISQRNGLRISCSTLRAPWLPREIFPPPAPPSPYLHVGYVSSDFNNHPLAHLMQSVFGLHNVRRVKAYCYATTPSDSSVHRKQIENEAPVFYDASSWSVEYLVNKIVDDGIHILINLNGYTRGARNEVFAARPAPIQMSFMGFAGTLGAEWCDYLLADTTAVPLNTLRPYRNNVDLNDQIADGNYGDADDEWVYGENIVFTRETFFCCDHRQSAPDAKEDQLKWPEEQARRWKMRKNLFPELPDDIVILGNFNQLYKIEPTTFRTWLRILSRLPKAVLWLLRFPDLGESHLRETALQWATPDVASRIIFTDVAPKQHHISRARVCDLFLDTPECNAHTTAADVLWSGTPLLTYPRYEYKMCSRIAASILKGALPKGNDGAMAAKDLIVTSDDEYEEKAVSLGASLKYDLIVDGQLVTGFGRGRLSELRRILYESRWSSPLFDTRRWVQDLEDAYEEAWRKWVLGKGGDIWLTPK